MNEKNKMNTPGRRAGASSGKLGRVMLMCLLCIGLLAPGVSASDASPATELQPQAAPGQAKYIVVLETKKGTQRPDFAASGATVDAEWGNRVAIRIPEQAVNGLRNNPNVKYLQRVMPVDEAVAIHQRSGASESSSVQASSNIDPTSSPANWSSGAYSYDGVGNITAIGTQQSYTYDRMSRLKTATFPTMNGPVTETYGYDSFGNMTSRTGTANSAKSPGAIGVNSANNRLSGAVSYDGAGNMTFNGTKSYHFDPVNMMRELTGAWGQQIYYIYTADDERIGTKDNGQGLWTWTVRDLEGKVQRKYESFAGTHATMIWFWTEDTMYRGSALLAAQREENEGGRLHYHLDHLGTPRQITNANREQLSQNDYYPFGQEASAITQMAVRNYEKVDRQFTGHERDYHGGLYAENVDYLDYMHARYYNPNLGRFLSVDPGKDWDMSQPQSWNMYSYVRNNPINKIDPTGRWGFPWEALDVMSYDHSSKAWTAAFFKAREQPTLPNVVDAGAKFVIASFDGAALVLPAVPAVGGLIQRVAGTGTRRMMTVVEEAGAAKQGDALRGKQREGYEQIKGMLASGLSGKNQHALKGDLKGWSAVDLPGSGKGRGAVRVIYKIENEQVIIKEFKDYHK